MGRNHAHHNSAEGVAGAPPISLISCIVACICITVYLGSMVFAGIRVSTGIKDRRTLAAKEFASLGELSSTLGSLEGFTDSFKDALTSELTKSKTLQGVIITGSLGNYTFERDQGKILAWKEDAPDFKPQFGVSREPLSKPVLIDNQVITLRAVYTYMDYPFLITLLKRTLLVVLATLCLALFTLIFQFLLVNPGSSPKYDPSFKDRGASPKPEILEKTPLEPEIPLAPAESPLGEESKGGIYEPRSYIGREVHTQDRLNAELKRCASFGQDLVFMVISLQKPAPVSEEDRGGSLLEEESIKFFLRRDLIFKRGDQGITIIIPSIDLDQGFAKSEKFHNRIITKYAELFNAQVELYIGLSSRADRTIDGERLIFEASGALEKAREDPSAPIVAFRSDPEKYKAFMAAQNKSQP